MGQKTIPTPVVIALIAVVVLAASVFLYKGVTGGTAGDGREGHVQASPPMPETAKQQMLNQMHNPAGGGGPKP